MNTQSLLLVDDDAELLKIFARRFTRRGYAVTAVEHPAGARAAVCEREFHVAIIDRTLPTQDGIELARDLQHLTPDLQVILLTGRTTLDPDGEAKRQGIYAYLTKPCRLDELEATTQRACEHREPVVTGVQ